MSICLACGNTSVRYTALDYPADGLSSRLVECMNSYDCGLVMEFISDGRVRYQLRDDTIEVSLGCLLVMGEVEV